MQMVTSCNEILLYIKIMPFIKTSTIGRVSFARLLCKARHSPSCIRHLVDEQLEKFRLYLNRGKCVGLRKILWGAMTIRSNLA